LAIYKKRFIEFQPIEEKFGIYRNNRSYIFIEDN
jgi:hypothetical protein